MSTSKKPLRKRKRQSPPPSSATSKINRRLDKLRSGQRNNLWLEDDDDNENEERSVQPKPITSNKTYIVLSDSDEDKATARRRSQSNKSRKKSRHNHDESCTSDNDYKTTSKCTTCLICSILTTLSSYNCCTKHLSLLTNNKKNTQDHHQKSTTNVEQYPPQHVMILPMTDELIQRYLNQQGVHHLRTQIPTSSSSKKTNGSSKSTRKLLKKSTVISEPSDTEHSSRFVSSTKSTHIEPDQSNSSSNTSDSINLPHSHPNLPDTTFTVITSTSTTINSFESPNILDTCQLQQSSDQAIIIDDSQPNTQSESLSTNNNDKNTQNNPWTPISDDTYAAIEVALDRVDQDSEEQTEFTPSTARRTATNLMASCLPKIQLKKGRFHQGKPIEDKSTSDTASTTSSESCSISTTTSVMNINIRPTPALATIVEDESLIIAPTTVHQVSEKSSHILSQRHENSSEGLSDTMMSNLFAQDELSQQESNLIIVKPISNHTPSLPPPAIIVEDCSHENENNRSDGISQSSQLSNDQMDSQPLFPSTTNEKSTITPARISYRTNPDGSRVSISRPALPSAHQQSPLISTRRISTEIISSSSHSII
ncbi:hypothetical protein I4U23_008059 [Adineta vaga]|nr:hypothetical protein I4U23_008059 [Adineta vaga]